LTIADPPGDFIHRGGFCPASAAPTDRKWNPINLRFHDAGSSRRALRWRTTPCSTRLQIAQFLDLGWFSGAIGQRKPFRVEDASLGARPLRRRCASRSQPALRIVLQGAIQEANTQAHASRSLTPSRRSAVGARRRRSTFGQIRKFTRHDGLQNRSVFRRPPWQNGPFWGSGRISRTASEADIASRPTVSPRWVG